ncbi:MAG: tryptophan 2,3-dioxygenase family protein [Gammaproteobacteria bacterium]
MSTVTYSSYLNLDKLLKLQTGSQPHISNDELLFITIHQVCELWFKLLINTFEKIRTHLNFDNPYEAINLLKRARMIIKTLVSQMDTISTLSPMAFNQYRSLLGGSSGLQSFQFREIEFILGLKRADVLAYYEEDSWEHERLKTRLTEQSVTESLKDFFTKYSQASEQTYHDQLINAYKTKPDLAILLDLILDIDEGLQEWRYRHVKLVERIIGTKQGTGGTKGLEFLKATLFKPFFPELWEIRSYI